MHETKRILLDLDTHRITLEASKLLAVVGYAFVSTYDTKIDYSSYKLE